MKTKTLLTGLAVISALTLSAGFASADTDEGKAQGYGNRFGDTEISGERAGHRGYRGGSPEMREIFESLSDEDREALHEAKRALKDEQKTKFEEFTGITREEARELKQNGGSIAEALADNGVTQESAEVFLTTQAQEKIDSITASADLTAEQEETVIEHIMARVTKMLNRMFRN